MTVTENVKRITHQFLALLALLLAAQPLSAQLQIEIVDGNPSALPIAIVPFE